MNLSTTMVLSLLSAILLASCGSGSNSDSPSPPSPPPPPGSDSYRAFGNTVLEVGIAPGGAIALRISGSVLDNDPGNAGMLVTGVTPGLGSVAMNPDGSFSYTPPTGFVGVDTFSYEADNGTDFLQPEVSINIERRIWYVDNTGAGGSGSSVDPFNTLSDALIVIESGDSLYLTGDGSGIGMDDGLSLTVSNIDVIGAGVPLVIDGVTLAPPAITPKITSLTDNVINLENVSGISIAGVVIDNAVADAILLDNASGIVLDTLTIQNSGESAIEAMGAIVELSLNNVSIFSSDFADQDVSDDAIFLHPSSSASLSMAGGSIDGVPGRLGDGIVLLNDDSSQPVDMSLTVTTVSFSNISQDAIKIDNENGLVNARIGGAQLADGNNLSGIGFRGIVIMSDGDPVSGRSNSIDISNNIIVSKHEAIQLRGIDDTSRLTINANHIDTDANSGIVTSAIDIQHDYSADVEARISNNNLTGNINSTGSGLRLRLFGGASLALLANENALDSFNTGFALGVRETTGLAKTRLDATILDTMLLNFVGVDPALNAVNYHADSEFCLDLRNNDNTSVYQVESPNGGIFDLTLASQAISLLTGFISNTPESCRLPAF